MFDVSLASTIFTVMSGSFGGARQLCPCSADLQPVYLKHNSLYFHVFLHLQNILKPFM